MTIALKQAQKSFNQKGIPVGAVLTEGDTICATGHNKRVQCKDPIAHGEMDCIRNAGRQKGYFYRNKTLYTTLSPCMMCAGTIVQFGIPRVVIGERQNFSGNIDFLKKHGVDVILLNDSDCISLMSKFISKYPDVWNEDIAEDDV